MQSLSVLCDWFRIIWFLPYIGRSNQALSAAKPALGVYGERDISDVALIDQFDVVENLLETSDFYLSLSR